ncbi:SsrA-binding protein SmpB [Myxococcota bacterium]|nr:SsrA-binding protein SmpB [Myxococcota bacterium]
MAKSKKKQTVVSGKVIVRNRKAGFEYHLEERFEAGISLLGSEVKSCRAGKVSLVDAYVEIDRGELWLVNAHIAEYSFANRLNHAPLRKRKLLMHRIEITRLGVKIREKGFTLIPLALYFNPTGKIKVEIALARGKKAHDKRDTIREKDQQRAMQRGDF